MLILRLPNITMLLTSLIIFLIFTSYIDASLVGRTGVCGGALPRTLHDIDSRVCGACEVFLAGGKEGIVHLDELSNNQQVATLEIVASD